MAAENAVESYDCSKCPEGPRARGMCYPHYAKWLRLGGDNSTRPTYTYNCEYCGVERTATRADARYCEDHGAPWKRIDREKTCEECGSLFQAATTSTRFCTRLCGQRNHRRRHKAIHALNQRARATTIRHTMYAITSRDIRRLTLRQNGECFYCRRVLVLTMDHVIPVSRGGVTSVGNLVLACRSCNSRKNNMTIMEFRIYCRNSEFQWIIDNDLERYLTPGSPRPSKKRTWRKRR